MLTKNLVVVVAAGLALYTIASGLAPRAGAASSARRSDSGVRPAGPETMEDRPRSWDMVDERADESFPASDPPGTY
ncbi:NADH:ubiquinone oxidoreductase subunit 3 (subunit A) [Roseovarius sp. MBR-154]|jgi:NADH:ubiquinone oxidoreductase subunit 3 (subunit A)